MAAVLAAASVLLVLGRLDEGLSIRLDANGPEGSG